MLEGVVVLEEGLKELGDAVLDGAFLEDAVDDEFGDELHVAQNVFLLLFQEDLLVLGSLKLGELFDLLVEGVLHPLDQKVFEGVVLLALLLLLHSLKLELAWVSLAEIAAQLGIGACVFRLVPGLLDDFLDEGLQHVGVIKEVLDDVLLDEAEILWDDEVEVVDDFLSGLLYGVEVLEFLLLEGGEVAAGHLLDLVLDLAGLKGLVLAHGDLHHLGLLRLVAQRLGDFALIAFYTRLDVLVLAVASRLLEVGLFVPVFLLLHLHLLGLPSADLLGLLNHLRIRVLL